MADLLKREYDLAVLAIDLEIAGEEPRVGYRFETRIEGSFEPVFERRTFPAVSMGLPRTLEAGKTRYRGYDFRLPGQVAELVHAGLERSGTGPRPLWIHLVKPYGYLGLVPWESLLQPELGRPILRLPDFLDRPRRTAPEMLDVAMCCSVPAAENPSEPVGDVLDVAEQIMKAGPSRTTLHLFTDVAAFPALRATAEERFAQRVRVYDPAAIDSLEISRRAERLTHPWLRWARDALAGQSVDVVHFLAHGFMARERGALALAESPNRNLDAHTARFVGAADLDAFSTQIGAWASVLSSPRDNFSEMGLRLLADTLAQLRPGPVVHHESRLDPAAEELGRAYRLLVGPPGSPPPMSPALFIYCHPTLVEEEPSEVAPKVRSGVLKAALPFGFEVAVGEDVPAWVAATHRFLEQRRFQIERLEKSPPAGADLRRLEERHRELEARLEALQKIELTLARVSGDLMGGER